MANRLPHSALAIAFGFVFASSGYSVDQDVSYLRDIKPLLVKHCFKCHSSIASEGDVRLDSHAAMINQAAPVVLANDVQGSRLIQMVRGADGQRMPPTGEGLAEPQIALLEKWIAGGAIGPPDGDEQRVEHWSFKPPLRSSALIDNDHAHSNLIDTLIQDQWTAHGLVAAPPADRPQLLRRLYIDLVGITPTPELISTFLADDRPGAYEAVVDDLLSSPLYSERWARHWMDIWRYSDWDGFGNEIRESQPHIWRWRDWIVESLDADKPYSDMIVEMLAADELPGASDDQIRATGFLARQWYKFNRNTWLENTVEHTSKAFMGTTMNCAKCHDHMYDPITQKEYYQFKAFFDPLDIRTDRVPGSNDTATAGLARIYDKDLAPKTYLFYRGNEKSPKDDEPLAPCTPRALGLPLPDIQSVALKPDQHYLARRAYVQTDMRAAIQAQVDAATADADKLSSDQASSPLARQLASVKLQAALTDRAAFEAKLLADDAKFSSDTNAKSNYDRLAQLASQLQRQQAFDQQFIAVLQKQQELAIAQTPPAADAPAPNADEAKTKIDKLTGELNEANKKLAELQKGLAAISTDYAPLTPLYPASSTGRRLALARWLTDPRHPLTARVAVNHVWMRHFGTPLVETVFDFGLNGRPPANQTLLDNLAVELMESGWSLKHLHRLIVTSDLYRQSQHAAANHTANMAIDPQNQFFWHAPMRRMEAEVVRDSTLAIAGNLDATRGGPDLEPGTADTTNRRSLYYRCSKEKRPTYLALFDGPSVVECYRRNESIVPQQALALMNSELNQRQSIAIANRVRECSSESPDHPNAAFVDRAYWSVLGRAPSAAELQACQQFIADQAAKFAQLQSEQTDAPKPDNQQIQSIHKAQSSLVLVLLNHHEFITVP